MVIGNSIQPIVQDGSVAVCIVIFLNNTKHKSSEFFDRFSIQEKYRFICDRKFVWGISVESGSWFSILRF